MMSPKSIFGFALLSLVIAHTGFAEKVREREKERESGKTLEQKLKEREGKTSEKAQELSSEQERIRTLEKTKAATSQTGSQENAGTSGTRIKDADSKPLTGSHQTENTEFKSPSRVRGQEAAETLGKGGRKESSGKELKAEEKPVVAEAAKKEDEAAASGGKGKSQKERLEDVAKYESEKSFYGRNASGKLEAKALPEGLAEFINRIAEKASPRTETLDLALRTLAEKMLAQGKSFEELEPALKELIEFWNKEVKGKLPKELQANALAYALASLHRSPESVTKFTAFLKNMLKEENAEVALKGLAMKHAAYGEVFLKALKEGDNIKVAHEKAVGNTAQFLKERGLTAKEISELPNCDVTQSLGLARHLLRSGQ